MSIIRNLKIRVDNLNDIGDYSLQSRFRGINHPLIGNPEDKILIEAEIERREIEIERRNMEKLVELKNIKLDKLEEELGQLCVDNSDSDSDSDN